ncbi:MAG: AAA family ATPase [Acidobacteriota bacterium]|nr:AAA family ATPase [Acidobacteriota bacterium]
MKLLSAHVQKFRNFDDSELVPIQPDITALVGKNESGKTAFLQALHLLRPTDGVSFHNLQHYPRWLYTDDRKVAGKVEGTCPVTCTFELEPSDLSALEAKFGTGVIRATSVEISRKYDGGYLVGQDVGPDEQAAVRGVVDRTGVPERLSTAFASVTTFKALEAALQKLEQPPADGTAVDPAIAPTAGAIRTSAEAVAGQDFHATVRNVLLDLMPRFFYFSEYHFIGGRTDLHTVFNTPEQDLRHPDRTALALLRLAGADNAAVIAEDYESRKAELEAVSNKLTDEMAEYWSQSQDLEVLIDVDKDTQNTPQGQTAVARYLEVRVKDRRHGHTSNIDTRSNGFRWFFSFLASFSEYEGRNQRMVILLDEPALTLHARAQRDFLRFIEERLSPDHQVIYSTHSPFMVEAGRLDRARLVEDKGKKVGSKVTADVMSTDRDTLFPLQAALGYDLGQNLFIAPHNLLLEGTSDFTYLQVLSDHLETLGRSGLDPRWTLLPVGSVTKVPSFLALLGHHLDVTVLVDAGRENQAIADLVRKGRLPADRFVTPAEITATAEADIEDLFEVDEYLRLYNSALGGTALTAGELVGADRILKRIERARGEFNHGRPADHLLRHRDEVLQELSETTLERFECLFKRLNATLP